MDFNLTSYAEGLRAQAAQAHAERTYVAEAKHQPPAKINYGEIVGQWWRAQPPRTCGHPWQLKTIAAAAFADLPRKPSIQHVAEALRRLGFTERRDWSVAGRNRRLWIPPNN